MDRLRSWRGQEELAVDMACMTHTGNIRAGNEDNFYFEGKYMPEKHGSLEKIYACRKPLEKGVREALFDGMGGEAAGETASYVAAKTFAALDSTQRGPWSEEELAEAVQTMNRTVVRMAATEKVSQMGTTVIILELHEDGGSIANLGDSPAYLYRDGELAMITQIHTNEALFKECGITNRKPGLTQFLGIPEDELQIEPYIGKLTAKEGDQYLLCSDGLTDMVEECEIAKVLSRDEASAEKIKALLKLALQNGGKDNITMILCRIIRERRRKNGRNHENLASVED